MARWAIRIVVSTVVVSAPASFLWAGDKNKQVALETIPPGAQVELNGAVACTTPCSVSLPSEVVGEKHTAFSKHATEPVSVRFLKDGCAPKMVTLTTGPVQWQSFSGIPYYKYYYVPATKFTITLYAPEPPSVRPGPPAYLAAASGPSLCGETASAARDAVRKAAQGAVVGISSKEGSGSGFFVRLDGMIVTSTTAVGSSKIVEIRLADGSSIQGSVLDANHHYGLALVQVHGSGFPVLELSRSAPKPGSDVYCIYAPPAGPADIIDGVTSVMVQRTYLNRLAAWVQTDEPLDRKNSGGPLLDRNARVVGVSTENNPLANLGLYTSPECEAVEKFLRSHLGDNWRVPRP